jgi:hypothetical protein
MKYYDAITRLETTIANLKVQKDMVLWDDYEKLEEVLGWIKHAQPVINAVLDDPKVLDDPRLRKALETA